MRSRFARSILGCLVSLFLAVALTAAACSKPAQEAAPGAGAQQSAAPGQPAADAAAAPAAAPGQPGAPSSAAQERTAAQGQSTVNEPAAPAASPGGPPPAPPAPAPPPPPPPPPRTFTLAAGTVLSVQTNYSLSTDKQSAGDKFEASLAESIVDGDWVIAKEGAAVEGLVVSSTKGGRVKGTAQMEVTITGLTLSDGRRIRIQAALAESTAQSQKKKDLGKVGIATGVGTAIGAIAGGGKGAAIGAATGAAGGTALVLGTRGKAAEIPARSLLQFQVTKPVQITERK